MDIEKIILIISLVTEVTTLLTMGIPLFISMSKIREGQKCQLRSDMLRIYYKNKDSEKIRQYEKENFIKCYEAYKALKGNSFIDDIKKAVFEWEVIT